MAVLRKEKKNNFTIIDNSIFRNRTISYKAKGLLCQMLSLPDGWEWSVEGLAKLSTDGKSAVASALEELTKAGYFRREQRMKDGKFDGYEYIVSEVQTSDFPFSENPSTENPSTENPSTENPPQLNTKESRTNLSRTNPSNNEDLYMSEFEELWKLYPRKQGKKKASDYYCKARKDGVTYEAIKKGVLEYRRYVSEGDYDEQFIKMGKTFFGQHAWEDDWSVDYGYNGSYEQDYGRDSGCSAEEPNGWSNIFGY